jgi:hypothetical protein
MRSPNISGSVCRHWSGGSAEAGSGRPMSRQDASKVQLNLIDAHHDKSWQSGRRGKRLDLTRR